jgi:hypothetical protein
MLWLFGGCSASQKAPKGASLKTDFLDLPGFSGFQKLEVRGGVTPASCRPIISESSVLPSRKIESSGLKAVIQTAAKAS